MSKELQLEYERRIGRMQEQMAKERMDACLITQNVGIYYFTGTMQTGYLFIPAQGKATLYVRRSVQRAMEEAQVPVQALVSFRNFEQQLSADYPDVFKAQAQVAIGADLDVLPAQLYIRLQQILPTVKWQDASVLLRTVRSVKSAHEIACIERVARVVEEAVAAGLRELREGMTELALIATMERELRMRGHEGMIRMRAYNQEIVTGMVAAGEAAATPTYFDGPAGGRGLSPALPKSASRRPIQRNEPILLDINCSIDGYVIDQTRTAVIGSLSPKLRNAYDAAVSILRRTEAALRPGAVPEDLYVQSVEQAAKANLADHYMGYGRDQVKFLGHGIGLEIDEWPVLARGFRDPLQPGMVIAVEPKFTFPGEGVVGIENSYVITEDGCKNLTRLPEELYVSAPGDAS